MKLHPLLSSSVFIIILYYLLCVEDYIYLYFKSLSII